MSEYVGAISHKPLESRTYDYYNGELYNYRQDFFEINIVNINDKVNSLTDKNGRIQRRYCAYNSADYRENEIERIRLCIFQQLCKNCKTAVVIFFTHRRLSPFQVLPH